MPFVLFLLGAAAVALVASQSKAKPKNGGRTYTLDSSLPPQLRQQVLAALATEKDPGKLLAFAAQCATAGYPLAAAALTQRAVELGGVPVPTPQPSPQPGPQPQPGPVNPVDPGMLPDPPRSQVLAALTMGTDPNALEALAQQMDAQGYTYAAQALRLKEAALRSMPSPAPGPAPQPTPVVPPGPSPQPQPSPAPNPFSLDPSMPPQMQAAVLGALTTEQDPNKLQAFAQEIQAQYPIAAGLLMAKANALRAIPGPSPLPQPGPRPVPAQSSTATVTTHDPPPAGDLKVFDRPNGTQIGGVDKNGTVTVLQWNADGSNQWARVAWSGGRWKAITGYVHQAYLSPVPAPAPVYTPPATAASAALAVRKGGANGLATHA